MDSIKHLAHITVLTLKRDFIAITLAIVLVTALVSSLCVYNAYANHREKAKVLVQNHANIISHSLTDSLDYAGYLMELLGKEINKVDSNNLQAVAKIFEPFANNQRLQNTSTWSVFPS